MSDERERRLLERVEARHCVFDMADVLDVGLDTRWRDTRLRQGRVVQVHHGVYRFGGARLTRKGQLLAAVLAAGPRGRASHRSGAFLHGLTGGRADLVEVTCERFLRARHDGLVVHESLAFDPVDHTEVDGIAVTTPARTLLDLGAVVRPIVVEMALDDALRKHLVTLHELRALLGRIGRRGRNGVGVLRRIVDARAPGAPAESPPERRMARMLVRNGLPEPVLQHEVRVHGEFVARVDAAYPQWRLAVEYDSFEHHTGTVAHVRDNDRRLALRRAGWEWVSVNAVDLRRGGTAVCATIRRIIRDRTRFGVTNQV